jgi:small basic protein
MKQGAQVSIASLVYGLLESTDILTKLIHLNIRFAESVIIAFVKLMISVAVFALVVSFSIRLFQRQRSIQRKLVNYEQYRRDVIHRWGKEEVSRVEAEL